MVKNKNKAFTIAELMVVLAIIGFISISLLSSIGSGVNKNKALFKKGYLTLEKTTSELVNNEVLYPFNSNRVGFRNTRSVPIPGEETLTPEGINMQEKFSILFANALNLASERENVDLNLWDVADGTAGWQFTSTDGISWLIINDASNNNITVVIDANGTENGLNTSDDNEGENKDQFTITVRYDGKISPASGEGHRMESEYLRSQNLR